MLKSKLSNITKCIFTVLGSIFIITSVFAFILSNIHTGIVLTFFIGILFILCGVFLNSLVKHIHKSIRVIFLCIVLLAFTLLTALFLYGKFDSVTYNEDAVLILGAGIRGDEPGENLANRLDAALDYYKKNPDAVFVVSGGRGRDEDVTEAFAMEKYLTEHGIPISRIIKEEQATSTSENFKYSKEILDNYFNAEYTTVFISSDYHILRAQGEAIKAGFNNVSHYHNYTPLYLILPNGIREILAIVKTYIFS